MSKEKRLRIKLPADHIANDTKLSEYKPDHIITLDDYGKQILTPMIKTKIDVLYGSIKLNDFPPLTRWQRFKINWCSYWSQYKYIWWIVKGQDIHEDCGY